MANKQNWRTPPQIFKALDKYFNFAADVFAGDENHLCDRYFTEQNSAFARIWGEDEWVFCNPPYHRGFILRSIHEAERQLDLHGARSVFLVPQTLETEWAHNCLKNHGILVGRGRVSFVDPDLGLPIAGNPWGSMLVIVGGDRKGVIGTWDCKTGEMHPYINGLP